VKKRRRSKPNPPKANLPEANSPAEAQSANAELPPPKARRKVVMERFEALFAGPLPTAAMYREYESAHPGTAERILAMAEKEQDARITIKERSLELKARQNIYGQLCGLLVAVLCIGAAVYITLQGNSFGDYLVAGILAGATVIVLVGHFIRHKNGG